MSYFIGIDLGGSSVKAIAVTQDGEKLAQQNLDFDAAEGMQWAEHVASIVRELEREQGSPAAELGLSAPGLAARDAQAIACMPGRLEGLVGLDWTDFLKRENPVQVLNDGHAALMGEAWLGAGQGGNDVIMLTLGTGVGGAALVEGNLLRGNIGRAGHFGHISLNPEGEPDICGTPASLEMAIGNCTIETRSKGRFKSTHELVSAHLAGDEEASRIWLKSVKALAAGVTGLINVLDPETVIIGGGIARAGDALFKPLAEFLDAMEWRPMGSAVRIAPAELGELAGAYGAASSSIRSAKKDTA
jgi:glucokinase